MTRLSGLSDLLAVSGLSDLVKWTKWFTDKWKIQEHTQSQKHNYMELKTYTKLN